MYNNPHLFVYPNLGLFKYGHFTLFWNNIVSSNPKFWYKFFATPFPVESLVVISHVEQHMLALNECIGNTAVSDLIS